MSYASLAEVLIVLPKDPGNLFLEASELISEVLQFVLHDSLPSVLLPKGLLEVIGLENPLQLCLMKQDVAKEAPWFSPHEVSTIGGQPCPGLTTSQRRLRR